MNIRVDIDKLDKAAIEKLALERVLKARSELILAHRFYGVLVSNVEPVVCWSIPTMATDGKRHYFNPNFVMSLTPRQLLGVQKHESEHDARHHGTRRGGRDHLDWNIAADYAINIDLIDQGDELPPKAFIDPKYRGMAAEDIYRSRELDKQKELPEPEETKDDESKDVNEGTNGDNPKDDEPEDTTSGKSSGDDAGEPEDKPEGEGAPGEGEEGNTPAEAPSGAGDGNEGESGEGNEPTSSGDPGGCGEVLDTAEDAGTIAEEDAKWERVVRQAMTMAKAAGQLPGHISREVERANNPSQDWREVLRAWFDQGALRRETWNRPNRRFAAGGLYLPGNERDGVNKVAFLIDTSGSMDTKALALVRNETQAALDDGVINEVVVVYGDTQVNRVDTYGTGEEIYFDPKGGGDTILRPLFEHVRDNHDDVSLIVCFSDMENYGGWGDEPSCNVLFAVTGYPQKVKQYLANTPWNAPGIDVGVH
jgi:predicted metal-dependent peptidase